eukprot:gene19673-19570_t
MPNPAEFSLQQGEHGSTAVLTGDWTAETLDDADGTRIERVKAREDPMEVQLGEADLKRRPHRLGRIALAGKGRVEDVACLRLPRGLAGEFQQNLADERAILS